MALQDRLTSRMTSRGGFDNNSIVSPGFEPKLRHWSLTGYEEQLEDTLKRVRANNPFTKIHTTKEGESVMLVAMEATHLINTIKYFLMKLPEENVARARADAMGSYAPADMDERVARTMHLHKPSQKELEEIEAMLKDFHSSIIEVMMEKAIPYIVVGTARMDTCMEVANILRDVTGISERVVYQRPSYNSRQLGNNDVPVIDDEDFPF